MTAETGALTTALVGLAGVVVGVFLTGVRDWVTAYFTRNRDAKYLAIRIVCILDAYLEACVDVVNDDGTHYGERHPDGTLQEQVPLPEFPEFPTDIDWRTIPAKLMYVILRFPNEIEAEYKIIQQSYDFASPPDYDEAFEARQLGYVRLGLTADSIARELRKKYDIPPPEYPGWEPAEWLNKKKVELDKQRQEMAEQSVGLDELLSKTRAEPTG
jgi:hypothetical protein